jgi:hypothetical protein
MWTVQCRISLISNHFKKMQKSQTKIHSVKVKDFGRFSSAKVRCPLTFCKLPILQLFNGLLHLLMIYIPIHFLKNVTIIEL